MPNGRPACNSIPEWRRALLISVLVLLLVPWAHAAKAAWDHVRADAANTGFVPVLTSPASLPTRRIMGIGPVPPGAGPVVATDGTVYVVNLSGFLKAFSRDGALKWVANTPNRKILASPVVGAGGVIYVVSARIGRDQLGPTLISFSPGGKLRWITDFPAARNAAGATSASPNIWSAGGVEVVMVPVFYDTLGGYEFHLMAFSTGGALMFNQTVTAWPHGDVSTDTGFCAIVPICINDLLGLDPTTEIGPVSADVPMPTVAIAPSPSGGSPVVVVADNYQYLVGYSFSPATGFSEIFRRHLNTGYLRMSSPVMLSDDHSTIRGNGPSEAWVLFGGPHPVEWPEIKIPPSVGTPTLTIDGRIVMVDRPGGVTVIDVPSRRVINSVPLATGSIAPAAASCNHVFISTADRLVTLDGQANSVVEQFFWEGGGLTSPAIGPDGTVYVLAKDTLHIFAPGKRPPSPPWWCQSLPSVPVGGGGVILSR